MARRPAKIPRPKTVEKFRWGKEGPEQNGCSWDAADTELIVRAIVALTELGCAIRFGLTRDRGAYSIGLYYGEGGYDSQYVRPSEDLDGYLTDLANHFEYLRENRSGEDSDSN